jgi:DNA replication protein DnaC
VDNPLAMYFKSFRLPTMAALTDEAVCKAEAEDWGYRKFLTYLCESEFQDRQQRRTERMLKTACLPEGKTLASLDEKLLPLKIRRMLPSLLDGTFVENRENLLCFGLPGRGKTHLAAALGRELVVRHGLNVLFVQSARLMERLLRSREDLRLEKELKRLDKFDLIIVDELGYMEHRRDEMELFFHFLGNCYERRSLIISSNLVFSQWGERIFKDPMTGMAAVDRLVHHGIILEFTNGSIREERAKEKIGIIS